MPAAAMLLHLRDYILDLVLRAGPDLTSRQIALFLTVYQLAGPHTVRGLAASLRISKPATTRSLDKLEEWKLLRRVPDPADRLSVLLVTTPTGLATFREMTVCMRRLIQQEKRRQPPPTIPAG